MILAALVFAAGTARAADPSDGAKTADKSEKAANTDPYAIAQFPEPVPVLAPVPTTGLSEDLLARMRVRLVERASTGRPDYPE